MAKSLCSVTRSCHFIGPVPSSKATLTGIASTAVACRPTKDHSNAMETPDLPLRISRIKDATEQHRVETLVVYHAYNELHGMKEAKVKTISKLSEELARCRTLFDEDTGSQVAKIQEAFVIACKMDEGQPVSTQEHKTARQNLKLSGHIVRRVASFSASMALIAKLDATHASNHRLAVSMENVNRNPAFYD